MCSLLTVHFSVINTPLTSSLLTSALQHSSYLCWQVYFVMSSTLQLPLLTSVLCSVINTPVTFVDKCTLLCHEHSCYLCWLVYFAMSSTLQLPLLTSVLCCVINTPVTFDWCTLLHHQHSSYLCWQVHIDMSSTLLLPLLTSVLCYTINTPVTFVVLGVKHQLTSLLTFVDKCTLLCHQHSCYLCWQVYFAMSSTLQLPLLTGVLCYVINTPVTFVDKCTLLCFPQRSGTCLTQLTDTTRFQRSSKGKMWQTSWIQT